MADSVALAWVVASGLVALGALVLTFKSGVEDRRYEARRALETRSWERKSEGLFDVIATCRALVDSLDRPGNIDAMETLDLERGAYEATVREHIGVSEIGVKVGAAAQRLQDLLPVVEVYGSDSCRKSFDELRRLLRDSGYDPRAADRLAAVRRGKVAAVDSKDYNSAATARRLEREILEDARNRLSLDLDETRTKAERLIEAAREDLNGQEQARAGRRGRLLRRQGR
jgi:hypothetical protein